MLLTINREAGEATRSRPRATSAKRDETTNSKTSLLHEAGKPTQCHQTRGYKVGQYLFPLFRTSSTLHTMSRSQVPPGLEHFDRLNPSIWYRQTSLDTSTQDAPQLVLLVGWMDATARHVSKYTAGYEKLYPSARILAITSTVLDLTLASEAAKSKRLAPIFEILYALPPDTKLLLHFFSNAGAIITMTLFKTYREKTGRMLPVTAVVMDSTPGKAKYETTIRAFSVSLPKNPILRVIGAVLLRVFFWVYILRAVMSGKGDEVEQSRKVFNDKSFFNVNTPRMYIYGVADLMVDFHFIEEHADEAERLDYKVDREKFLESGHCAHLLDNQDRYWATVQRLWKTVS
jgi:hypothetical protein